MGNLFVIGVSPFDIGGPAGLIDFYRKIQPDLVLTDCSPEMIKKLDDLNAKYEKLFSGILIDDEKRSHLMEMAQLGQDYHHSVSKLYSDQSTMPYHAIGSHIEIEESRIDAALVLLKFLEVPEGDGGETSIPILEGLLTNMNLGLGQFSADSIIEAWNEIATCEMGNSENPAMTELRDSGFFGEADKAIEQRLRDVYNPSKKITLAVRMARAVYTPERDTLISRVEDLNPTRIIIASTEAIEHQQRGAIAYATKSD